MNRNDTNPASNVPKRTPEEPLGDRGGNDKTWSPAKGEQGISNRPDDEDSEAEQPADAGKDQ